MKKSISLFNPQESTALIVTNRLMGLLVYKVSDFSHTAEREQYRAICQKLKARFSGKPELCIFVANWNIYDSELDGLLIKQDAIIAIEFKDYGGKIIAVENGDWKSFVQAELNDVKNQIEEIEKQEYTPIGISKDIQLIEPNIKKQVLEMRLEKDIPYGNDNNNFIIEQWEQSKRDIANYKETEKTKALTYEEKVSKQNAEALLSLCEYYLKNNLDEDISLVDINQRWNLATEADSDLISSFAGYELLITIAIVVIAGTIISEEFNKGTIKLLLVRPYKRAKILIAKFIACMVVLFLAYITTAILQLIMGGITNGFGNYIGKAMIYNYKTNAVEEISTIKYLIISGIAILPQYILIMTLAFSFSVIFVNSPLAIALPLLGMMGAEIINELAYHYEKAKFLRFFVTQNWKLNIYLFGKLPEFEPISLPFSIVICLIYFVIMIATSIFIFKRKEIKNI